MAGIFGDVKEEGGGSELRNNSRSLDERESDKRRESLEEGTGKDRHVVTRLPGFARSSL